MSINDGFKRVLPDGRSVYEVNGVEMVTSNGYEWARLDGKTIEQQGRCATCRWAKEGERPWWDGEPEAPDREDMSVREQRKYNFPLRCERAEYDEEGKHDAARLCVTMDGSDYVGELWVKPDFGCVQWQAKDDPAPETP